MALPNWFPALESISAAQQLNRDLDQLILSGLADRADYNPDDRAPEDPDKLTDEWMEFASRCSIISGRDVIPFIPFDYQVLDFNLLEKNAGMCVGKTRQLGFTEARANRCLFKASKSPAYRAALFSLTGDDTAKVAERTKLMAMSNPDIEVEKANSRELKVAGGGAVYFRTSTAESGRGLPSLSELVFDEWGFLRDDQARSIYGAVTPAQAMVGDAARTSMICTPPRKHNGQYMEVLLGDNSDRDVFELARAMREGRADPVQHWVDDGGWVKLLLHWRAHPVYSKRKDYLIVTKRKFKLDEVTLQREHNLNYDVKGGAGLADLSWFPRYRRPASEYALIVQSWDTAQTVGPVSARWGHFTFGVTHDGFIDLLDCYAKKHTLREGIPIVKSLGYKWSPNVILVENKSTGADVEDELSNDPEFNFPVVALTPPRTGGKGDDPKARRFAAEIFQMESGRVRLPESAPWLTTCTAMLETAPSTDERDLMDAYSQGLRWIREDLAQYAELPSSEESLGTIEDTGSSRSSMRRSRR
ncbi:MAG: hypothetical protein AAFO83_01705 [Cyanobacteria bacterium J06607_13]